MNSGPLPKDSAHRRRRNATPSLLELPADGYQGPVPAWPMPLGPTVGEAAVWESLWRRPQAAAWAGQGYELAVARLAVLTVAAMGGDAPSAVLTEVRQLEDRLGLNPAAMQRLRWKIISPEEGRGEAEVVPMAKVRRVKAVD